MCDIFAVVFVTCRLRRWPSSFVLHGAGRLNQPFTDGFDHHRLAALQTLYWMETATAGSAAGYVRIGMCSCQLLEQGMCSATL
jgi:hypothetical protein